ncbi:MAG: 1-phosphofructokinase family hexose kinase [Bacteroidota bacterium]
MPKIITLTINPSVDKNTRISGLRPDSKLRCSHSIAEPGGGGINVSRAIYKLGGQSTCVYLAGGSTGELLQNLLESEQIPSHRVPIEEPTRENIMVVDDVTDQQYRLIMEGPNISSEEWQQSITQVTSLIDEGDFVVASGSLPVGVPVDYYAKVAEAVRAKGGKIIVDTSGEALKYAANAGVYLLKPNLGELSSLTSQEAVTGPDQEQLAQQMIDRKMAEVVVVSLGPKGAMLVTDGIIEYITAPTVHKKSTVGAGDSMVAGMVMRLSQDWSLVDAVRYGVACGTAAVMTEDTQLCEKEDVEELYGWIMDHANR